jgi:hypothetical protein
LFDDFSEQVELEAQKVLRAASDVAKFLERDVLEAGITLGSAVLFAAVGAAVVGLVLQQFLDRLVWLVFLAGVGAANIVLLYVWVDAYIPVNVEAGLPIYRRAIPRSLPLLFSGSFCRSGWWWSLLSCFPCPDGHPNCQTCIKTQLLQHMLLQRYI